MIAKMSDRRGRGLTRSLFSSHSNDSGFTLVETMVVVVMIILMAAISIPKVMGIMPRYRLKEAARNVYQNIQLAKMTAIKEGSRCVVVFSSNGYSFFLDLNQNFVMDGSDKLIKQISWSEFKDVNMSSCNLPSSKIAFTPDGRSLNVSGGLGIGTIKLQSNSGAGSLDIVISSAGNVKVE